MRRIWKAPFEPNSVVDSVWVQTIKAREGAVPLNIGLQSGQCVVWFEVEENAPDGVFSLLIVGTGFGRVPDESRFLGTIINGPYVWHVYC